MGGSYTGFSLGDSAVSDVTVETDADGYVQSVTVVSDSAERLVRLSGAHDGVLRLCGRVCQMELAVCRPHEG